MNLLNDLEHKDVWARAVWTFVQAFAAAFLVLAPGILAAPNLTDAKALSVSAALAGIAAGISALKNYAKQFVY
jgi:hypothetical protein